MAESTGTLKGLAASTVAGLKTQLATQASGGSDGQTYYAKDGTPFKDPGSLAQYEATRAQIDATNAASAAATKAAADALAFNQAQAAASQASTAAQAQQERVSAYTILQNEFNKYGLGSLVPELTKLVAEGYSPAQYSLALQNTDAYKKRFAANQDRINKGLRALTPAEYIGLEDQYQNIMRNYGLPASYYAKGDMGIQEGFNKLIANDVSASELEDRVMTAQKRVINADPNVMDALRRFYPDINTGDLLAYTLDPTNALENVKRKVTAAEIGGAAVNAGLNQGRTAEENAAYAARAEELAKYGITKAQAQQGYQTIGEFLPTAQKLGDIYAQQGAGPYSQLTAEQEVFGTAGATEAAKKRKKLAQLEQATFGGAAGTSQGALSRDRALTAQMLGVPGAGQI